MIISEDQIRSVLKIQAGLKAQKGSFQTAPGNKVLKPSSHTEDLKLVEAILRESPEIRRERVSSLKDHISQGEYRLPASNIASKMLNRSLVDNALTNLSLTDGI